MPWGGNYFFFIPSAESPESEHGLGDCMRGRFNAQLQNTSALWFVGTWGTEPGPLLFGVRMKTIPHTPLFHSHCLAATFWKERKMADVKIPNEHDSCGLNDPFAINPWKNIYWINRGCDLSQWGCCWTWAGSLIVKSSRHRSHGVYSGGLSL